MHFVLTRHSGPKLHLMVPCHSIMITLYTLESLRLLTAFSSASPLILMTRTTNKDSTGDIYLQLAYRNSKVTSLSSCRRFVFYYSVMNKLSTTLSRTRKFGRPRNSETVISANPSQRVILTLLSPCGATVVPWSSLSGMTSIRVSLRLESEESEMLPNEEYRKLHKAL